MLSLVRLESGFVNAQTKAPGAEASNVIGAGPDDVEPYGTVPLMMALGLVARPYPPTDEGYAEAIQVENIGGQPAIAIAGWDTRSFSMFGNLADGDVCLHSLGPSRSAQVLLKEEKRQAILATTDEDGTQQLIINDGLNRKIQILIGGTTVEVTEDHILLEFGSAGIRISSDGIHLRGPVTVGGLGAVTGMSMAVAAIPTWAALSALSGPIVPIPNAIGAV